MHTGISRLLNAFFSCWSMCVRVCARMSVWDVNSVGIVHVAPFTKWFNRVCQTLVYWSQCKLCAGWLKKSKLSCSRNSSWLWKWCSYKWFMLCRWRSLFRWTNEQQQQQCYCKKYEWMKCKLKIKYSDKKMRKSTGKKRTNERQQQNIVDQHHHLFIWIHNIKWHWDCSERENAVTHRTRHTYC